MSLPVPHPLPSPRDLRVERTHPLVHLGDGHPQWLRWTFRQGPGVCGSALLRVLCVSFLFPLSSPMRDPCSLSLSAPSGVWLLAGVGTQNEERERRVSAATFAESPERLQNQIPN